MAIILAIFVVKSSRVDSFKNRSFICGGGLLGLQEFKPQLFTMTIYPNPVGIMNYQLWNFQIQLLNLLTNAIFESGAYGVSSKLQNKTILDRSCTQ